MSGFEPPSPLRKGQALFNFLVWLGQQEKVKKTFICYTGKSSTKADDEHFHLGDPFFITDERWDELWVEWVNSLEPEITPKEK